MKPRIQYAKTEDGVDPDRPGSGYRQSQRSLPVASGPGERGTHRKPGGRWATRQTGGSEFDNGFDQDYG